MPSLPASDSSTNSELLRAGLRSCAAGFGISESTAHACTSAVIDLLAERAPGLLKVLRETDAHFVLLDGTLAECDRVGDGRADYSTSTADTG